MKKLNFVFFIFILMVWVKPLLAQELHPQGKFNFLKGRDAYNKKDFNTALQELKAYTVLDDKNHQVLNLLAQTYHQLKDIQNAEIYYKKAIDLVAPTDETSPYSPLYKFNLGVLLYDQKKMGDALPYLESAAANMPIIPKEFGEKKGLANYYVAFIHYEKERWAQAKPNFEKAAKYSPDLRQGAQFYYAICEYKLGNVQSSVERFRLAERLDTSQALTNYAKQFIDRLQKHKPQSRFGLTTGLQFIHDTNVFLNADVDQGSPNSPIEDERGETLGASLEPSYLFPLDTWNGIGKYNFAYGRQTERHHRDNDYNNHSANVILMKDFDGGHRLSFDTGVDFAGNRTHKKIKTTYAENMGFFSQWNELFSTDIQLGASWLDFPEPAGHLGRQSHDRDGIRYSFAEMNHFNILDIKCKFTLGAGGNKALTEGSNFDSTGFMATAGVNYTINETANAGLTFKLDRNKFTGRITQTQTASVSVFKQWPLNISSSIGYSYIDGYGNLGPTFDYTRHLATFNLYHQL